jgi:hypothetical protein
VKNLVKCDSLRFIFFKILGKGKSQLLARQDLQGICIGIVDDPVLPQSEMLIVLEDDLV